MAPHGFCQHNALSQSVDGRLTSWPVVQRFIDALRGAAGIAGTTDALPADLDERARELWEQASATAKTTDSGTPRARRKRCQAAEPPPTTSKSDGANEPVLPVQPVELIVVADVVDLVARLNKLVRDAGYDVSALRYLMLDPPTDIGARYLAGQDARDVLTGKTAMPDPEVVRLIVMACGHAPIEASGWVAAARRLQAHGSIDGEWTDPEPPSKDEATTLTADPIAALCEPTLHDLPVIDLPERPPRLLARIKSAVAGRVRRRAS
jgi:hypothetical protein